MTFAALATWQGWLVLAGAGALAAALFLIKLRPPRILIPSLSLWQRVLDASPDVTRWEKIRRAVSLIITILIAIALGLAVVRPSRLAGAGAAGRGRTLIVLDSSWSMLARTHGRETRWDRALAEARRIAATTEQVAIATTADGLVQGLTDDVVLVESALARLSPAGYGDTSWPTVSGVESVHFITDGAVARHLDPSVVVHSVFEPVGNVAITAFDVRPTLAPARRGPDAEVGTAYLEVANFSLKPQTVHITMVRGKTTIADNRTDLAAGEAYRQVVPLVRRGDPDLHAHVEAADNALDVDDDGFAWIARAQPLAVTVVGEHTEWLKRLLGSDPDVRATFVTPSTYRASAGEDVTIFDRWAPSTLASTPALYFAPPDDTPWLDAAGTDERRPRWDVAGAHAVLTGVDPITLRVDRARDCSSPLLAPVARSTKGTPLVCVGESADRRAIVVGFGPSDSNLASAPAFPVLVANALEWLGRPQTRDLSLRPGLTSFTEASRVTRADGESIPLTGMPGEAFGVLAAPGLYGVRNAGARNTIAVNAADPQRSNVARTSLTTSANVARARGALERPWWLACALLAFVLAFAEWWTWQRRVTV
jgi:hypothetical protein